MTATAHALVGAAIAASVPNPAIGITLAALSHPILDAIPHWDFGQGWRKKNKIVLFAQSILDLALGVFLAFLFFGKIVDPLYLGLAIFFSEIWDVFMMPYLLFNWKFIPFSTFYKVQHEINSKMRLPWGILTQAATVSVAVLAMRAIR